jgi:hypothetical protein
MRRLFAILVASGALIVALPAAAADAHVSIRSFDIAPACTTPGGTVDWSVEVNQNHWYEVHKVYSRVIVKTVGGTVVSQEDDGPRYVWYGTYRDGGTKTIPGNAPTGDYTVTLQLGSTPGGSEWGTASAPLRVVPSPILCNF